VAANFYVSVFSKMTKIDIYELERAYAAGA
jgi:hypothetical protein